MRILVWNIVETKYQHDISLYSNLKHHRGGRVYFLPCYTHPLFEYIQDKYISTLSIHEKRKIGTTRQFCLYF